MKNSNFKFLLSVSLVVLSFAACNSAENRNSTVNENSKASFSVEPSHDIILTKSHTIEDDLNNFVGNMSNFSVDSNGNVYVMSRGIIGVPSIHIYGPSGQYIDKIGQKGRGPGDFQIIEKIFVQSDILYVYDELLKRFSLFSTENLDLINTITLQNDITKLSTTNGVLRISSEFYPFNKDTIIVRLEEYHILQFLSKKESDQSDKQHYHIYYMIGSDGKVFSDFRYQSIDNRFGDIGPFPMTEDNLPHQLNYGVTFNSDGKIFSTPSDSFLIKIEDIFSDEQRIIKFPFDNSVLEPDTIISHYSESNLLRDISASYSFPEVWPAINRFLLDDENRLWVSTITSSYDEYEWWVIGEEGELIAKFNWPGSKLERGIAEESIKTIKNGKIYSYELNKGSEGDNSIGVYNYSFTRK